VQVIKVGTFVRYFDAERGVIIHGQVDGFQTVGKINVVPFDGTDDQVAIEDTQIVCFSNETGVCPTRDGSYIPYSFFAKNKYPLAAKAALRGIVEPLREEEPIDDEPHDHSGIAEGDGVGVEDVVVQPKKKVITTLDTDAILHRKGRFGRSYM